MLCWIALLPLITSCSTAQTPPSPTTAPTRGGALIATPSATLPPTNTPPATRAATASASPGATTTRAVVSTATRAASTTPGGGTPGPIPAGWAVYRGGLSFTIAYPPGWRIDDRSAQGLIYFYAPTAQPTTFLVIATTGKVETNTNLDVLRDRWYQARIASCQGFAVERTGQARYAGIDFATVGATCDLPTGLAYSDTGIGLRKQVPWIFEFNAPYGDYAARLADSFEPMIRSWTFDDPAGR